MILSLEHEGSFGRWRIQRNVLARNTNNQRTNKRGWNPRTIELSERVPHPNLRILSPLKSGHIFPADGWTGAQIGPEIVPIGWAIIHTVRTEVSQIMDWLGETIPTAPRTLCLYI